MSWSFHDARIVTARIARHRRLLAGAPTVALLMSGIAAAAQTMPRLEVDVGVLASENPLLLSPAEEPPGRGAVLLDISARPGVRFTGPTGSFVDLGAVVTHRRYSRRYGDFLIGRGEAQASYRRDERLTIAGSASVARDLAVDLLTSSVESGVDPLSIRTAAVGRLSLIWRPDERSWIEPEVSIDRFGYDRSSVLGDTRSFNAALAFRRRTSARTTIGVRGGTINSDTARFSRTDTRFLYATMARQLSTNWQLTAELGAERAGARTETVAGVGAAQRARTRIGGRAELCRRAPDPVICVTAALNSEVSGLGGLQRRAVVTASLNKRLDERTTIGLEADYQRTVMQGTLFPTFDAVRTVATVERRIARDLRIGATVQYLRRRTIDGTRVGAGYAGVRMTFAPVLR